MKKPAISDHKRAVKTAQRALQTAKNAEALAHKQRDSSPSWFKRIAWGTLVFGTFGFVGTHWPSVDIRLLDNRFDSNIPFPDSIEITNSGGSFLYYVSPKMRICDAATDDLRGRIAGRVDPSCAGPTGGRGGFQLESWPNHRLERGEHWPLPIAADRRFKFIFNIGRADVSAYVEYWPIKLPFLNKLPDWKYFPVFWTERRFVTTVDRDGKPIWREIPLD